MRAPATPLAALLAILASCSPTHSTQPDAPAGATSELEVQFAALAPGHQQDLATVRAANSAVRDTAQAAAAGYVIRATECRNNQPAGGMGYHYLNPDRITATPSPTEPQILVFAPRNGRVQLGAVEYIIPYALVPADATPPELFGQAFHHNSGDQLWMLHVWLWRHNPDGIFADWNPAVDCG